MGQGERVRIWYGSGRKDQGLVWVREKGLRSGMDQGERVRVWYGSGIKGQGLVWVREKGLRFIINQSSILYHFQCFNQCLRFNPCIDGISWQTNMYVYKVIFLHETYLSRLPPSCGYHKLARVTITLWVKCLLKLRRDDNEFQPL